MSKRRPSPDPDRRKFLKGATLAGAAALTPVAAEAGVNAGASGPVAAAKALHMAAAAGPCEASPAPSERSSGRLISSTSTLGTSGMVRIG